MSRRVLKAALDSYPDNGVIVSVRLQHGWGETIQVELVIDWYPTVSHLDATMTKERIRKSIEGAVQEPRVMARVTERI